MPSSSDTEKDSPTVLQPDASPVQETRSELVAAPSVALVAAVRRASAYQAQTKAKATEAAYKGDWARFSAWMAEKGARAAPAAPEIVAAYLSSLADDGYSVSTIERALAAVIYHHRAQGHDFRRGALVIGQTLDGIRRTLGTKRTKKAPLGLKALAAICERLRVEETDGRGPERSVALRNRTMLSVGWFCMLRSANLVAIRREHVRLVRFEDDEWIDDYERPDGLIVHLPHSKTDQQRGGRDVAVHAQDEEGVCPVRALRAYLRDVSFRPGDLIFPVSERTVARLVKRLVANPDHGHTSMKQIVECDECAVAADRFASHSIRRGAATTQAMQGVEEREIMRQGGWRSERVMRGYIEHATIFQNNPTKGLSKKPSPAPAKKKEEATPPMPSTHALALESVFEELLQKEPEWAKQTAIVRNKIADGFYPKWLVDSFFQNFREQKPTLAEAYCFSQLYASYLTGEICIFSVPLSSGPHGDKQTSENQGVLDGLPPIFKAKFLGGAGDNDGHLELKSKIEISRVILRDGSEHSEPWICEPCRFPLEVGYTAVSKTHEHVHSEHGVARWPYGHSELIVLVTHPSLRERRDSLIAPKVEAK